MEQHALPQVERIDQAIIGNFPSVGQVGNNLLAAVKGAVAQQVVEIDPLRLGARRSVALVHVEVRRVGEAGPLHHAAAPGVGLGRFQHQPWGFRLDLGRDRGNGGSERSGGRLFVGNCRRSCLGRRRGRGGGLRLSLWSGRRLRLGFRRRGPSAGHYQRQRYGEGHGDHRFGTKNNRHAATPFEPAPKTGQYDEIRRSRAIIYIRCVVRNI